MVLRLQETTQSLPWLVTEDKNKVLGFCYASKWKGRCAYRYSVESTVYLRPNAAGNLVEEPKEERTEISSLLPTCAVNGVYLVDETSRNCATLIEARD
jgi:hypothetical protein